MFHRITQIRGLTWSAGLLSLAILFGGLAVAAPDDEPKKDDKKTEQKKEEPKKETKKDKINKNLPVPGVPDLDDILKNLPQNIDPEQLKEMQKEMQRMMEQMRLRFQGGAGGGFAPGNPFAMGWGRDGRLGARVSQPSPTLADQLDLPKGQGVVIEDVQEDSAAAKAGIKSNDILLEVNGKAVPANPREFMRMLEDVKANTAVDAVVLRKGKRETIKGLSLPEGRAVRELPTPPKGFAGGGGPPAGLFPPGGGPGAIAVPPAFQGGGAQTVTTTLFRTDNRFTTRHQEGSLIITVTGTVGDGKAQVSSINVQDGRESHKYENVDKVPEQYRDKVKNLIEVSEKSGVKIEIKEPKIK
jgi:hypothetical protein